jgi:hypothetical protein
MLEERQHQTNHKYDAPTRHIKCLYQLYTQVKDLRFLLRLPEQLNHSRDALRLDKTAGYLDTIRFLNRVRKYLGRELEGRRCGAAILVLYEACLENISEHNQFPNAAASYDSDPIHRLQCDLDWAIQQNAQRTKDMLLMVGLAEPGDFAS